MEEEEVVLETRFPTKERVVSQKTSSDFAKLPKTEAKNRLKPVKRPEYDPAVKKSRSHDH